MARQLTTPAKKSCANPFSRTANTWPAHRAGKTVPATRSSKAEGRRRIRDTRRDKVTQRYALGMEPDPSPVVQLNYSTSHDSIGHMIVRAFAYAAMAYGA